MSFRDFWNREKYVAIHAQTWKFRSVKYIILFAIGVLVFEWKSWPAVIIVFGILLVASLCVHFFYRYKTDVWTKSWGGYKKLNLPKE